MYFIVGLYGNNWNLTLLQLQRGKEYDFTNVGKNELKVELLQSVMDNGACRHTIERWDQRVQLTITDMTGKSGWKESGKQEYTLDITEKLTTMKWKLNDAVLI